MTSSTWLRWIAALAFLGVALCLVEAQFHLVGKMFGSSALTHRELATEVLGRYLAGRYPGKTALVLSNPFSQKPGQPPEVYKFEQAGLRGLRRGLGSAVHIQSVVFPEIKPGFLTNRSSVHIDPSTTTPLSYIVEDGALDRLTRDSPQAELVVSFIGLPLKVRQTTSWKQENATKFALLFPDLRVLGDESALREAFASGKIAAAVMNKPGAPAEEEPLGRDLKMEFDRRFLLVSPDTFDRVLQVYPRLFR